MPLILNGDGSVGPLSATEVGYLDNVTSAVQTQINNKVSSKILQVVNGKDSSTATTTSNTYSTGLTVSITRTVSGSSFLIFANVCMGFTTVVSGNADTDNYGVAIGRDSVELSIDTRASPYIGNGFAGSDAPIVGAGTYGSQYDSTFKPISITDTPAGSVGTIFQYKVLFRSPTAAGGTAYYNRSGTSTSSGGTTTMTIFEVAP